MSTTRTLATRSHAAAVAWVAKATGVSTYTTLTHANVAHTKPTWCFPHTHAGSTWAPYEVWR